MKEKEHDITLGLILQASRKVGDYLSGYDRGRFLANSKTQSAVIMQLVVIGELAKKLPEGFRQKIDLPWKLMAGFRDFAVHEYFELDLDKVCETAVNDVPVVKEKLEQHPS